MSLNLLHVIVAFTDRSIDKMYAWKTLSGKHFFSKRYKGQFGNQGNTHCSEKVWKFQQPRYPVRVTATKTGTFKGKVSWTEKFSGFGFVFFLF